MQRRPLASGHITIIQENRFRLLTDRGQSLLFTLAHNAPLQAADLHRFRDRHTPVVVEFEGDPDLASGIARAVREAGVENK